MAEGSSQTKVSDVVADKDSLQGDFLKAIQVRGATVIKARGNSSAMSAANAAADHCRDWMQGYVAGLPSVGYACVTGWCCPIRHKL